MHISSILFALTLVLVSLSWAVTRQDDDVAYQEDASFSPEGYWTGAIIKDGSVFPLTVNIERVLDDAGTGFEARTTFPDRLFYEPRATEEVVVTEDGIVIRDLLDRDAVLMLEREYGQLVGTVGDDRQIHLKRGVSPPAPLFSSTATRFRSADGAELAGTLTIPTTGEVVAGMVMMRGRGCARGLNGRARYFARYGIAVLTYDKRGAGQSEGDCATFTLRDLTEDALAALAHLARQPKVDVARVGFWGESAGAWTVQAAAQQARRDVMAVMPAFIITWIGPSTSIRQ